MDIEEIIADLPPVEDPPHMDLILNWIGFDQLATREHIHTEGFESFEDLLAMKEKDICDLSESYSRHTVADGRIIFGLRKTRYMIGLIHWVQDFGRVGETPSIVGIPGAAEFRIALDAAFYRADVRKVERDQADTVSKAADPGKFKDEQKWPEWEPSFVNYLSCILGVSGVPLSYVVRDKETPEAGVEYNSFNEQAIACCPLVGPTFQADARKVHQLIKSFLQTETAEQWIKPFARHQNGRMDMEALRNHYSGEGNTSRRIAQAERYRNTLHYKNKKSMLFSAFLDKMRRMFNIFQEENEIISEQAKVRTTFDGSQEQCGKKTEFMANVRKYSIDFHVTEPYRPNHNFAESVIREVRKKWFRVMVRKSVPQRLWDYGLQSWVCDIQNRTANSSRGLMGRCPLERVTGETIDISEYLDFGFNEWVWFRENAGLGERKLGRWLGVSHRVGTLMSFWVATSTGKVLSRTTVQRVTNLELQLEENKVKCATFTASITERLGGNDMIPIGDNGEMAIPDDWDDPRYDQDFVEEYGRTVNDPAIREADQDFTPDSYDDTYLNMELALPRDGAEVQFGRVVKRLRDKDELPIGTAHDNPILDTRLYEVEFQDGHKASMAANAIAENLFAQVDDKGNRHVLFEEIIDHRTNGKQLTQQDAFIVNRSGTKRRRETTIGWELLVRWKDGSTTWVSLKDLKESYPVQLAEYAVQSCLADLPKNPPLIGGSPTPCGNEIVLLQR